MAVYNEEDIIYHSIKRLIDQEIYVYVIDNWSTDSTYNIAKQFEDNNFFIGIEKYPSTGPEKYFCLQSLLKRKEELVRRINVNWFINIDADEIREAPWPELNLKQGIFLVDSMGFNAIDHTELAFLPVDNGFVPGSDFEQYFKYCKFVIEHPSDYFHIKAWKKPATRVFCL